MSFFYRSVLSPSSVLDMWTVMTRRDTAPVVGTQAWDAAATWDAGILWS